MRSMQRQRVNGGGTTHLGLAEVDPLGDLGVDLDVRRDKAGVGGERGDWVRAVRRKGKVGVSFGSSSKGRAGGAEGGRKEGWVGRGRYQR